MKCVTGPVMKISCGSISDWNPLFIEQVEVLSTKYLDQLNYQRFSEREKKLDNMKENPTKNDLTNTHSVHSNT